MQSTLKLQTGLLRPPASGLQQASAGRLEHVEGESPGPSKEEPALASGSCPQSIIGKEGVNQAPFGHQVTSEKPVVSTRPGGRDAELNRLLLDQLADKWSLLVLQAFCDGPGALRFNEIKRRVPGVSQKTLTQCLRRLERNGILRRRVVAAAPLGVEYSITPLGDTLAEPFAAMRRWAEAHLPEVQEAQARFDESDPDRRV